jgi:quercetin dioxygenase-like cupin family protein
MNPAELRLSSVPGGHALTLYEDRLAPAGRVELAAAPRVLYVADGRIEVTHAGARTDVGAGGAWQGSAGSSMAAGPDGARVLRYELRAGPMPLPAPGAVLLDHPIALDPEADYLMRCDRVDFAPGGEALPHGHRGGGIRWLLDGALEVRVGGRPGRLMKPGDAWFESGAEPVHAIASREAPTSFIRVSILPREILGKSSIVYADPAHAAVKPRRYTVYVDAPVELP